MKSKFTKYKGRLIAVALLAAFSTTQAISQTNLDYKAVDGINTTGTYTDLGTSGSAITVANNDNANSAALPIGFTFNFNGTNFTDFSLNTNGFIKLGSVPISSQTAWMNIYNASDINLIAPLTGIDLQQAANQTATPTEFRLATSGTAPNRITTIQFKNLSDKATVSGSTTIQTQFNLLNFQVKLYEGSNNIEFVYGPWTPSSNAPDEQPFIIGIKGSAGTVNNRLGIGNIPLTGTSFTPIPWPQSRFETATTINGQVFLPTFFGVNSKLPDPGRTFRFVKFIPPANDLAVAGVYALGKLPNLPETNPYAATAAIVNTGSGTRTNVPVTLNITGAMAFNTTATIANIASGDTAYITFPPYSATAAGTITLSVSVPADDDVSNNSKTFTQILTTGQISYAQGNPPGLTNALRPTGTNATLLAKFNVNGPINVNAPVKVPSVDIMISFHAPSVGNTVYAVLYDAAGTLIGRSQDYVIKTSDLSTMKTFNITNPPTLAAGEFYAGLAVVAPSNLFYPLGAQEEDSGRPGIIYTSPITGGMPTRLKNNYRPIIQPLLFKCINIVTPVLTAGGSVAVCSGNPVDLTAATTTTGVAYEWYRDGSLIPGATGRTYRTSQVGTYTVAAISGICNSSLSNPITITNDTPDTPIITVAGPATLCQGSSVLLTGYTPTAGVSYRWLKNGVPITGATGATYNASVSGSYMVSVISATNCTVYSLPTSIIVNSAPATPTVTTGGPAVVCPGRMLTLSATPATSGITFQWLLNGSVIAGATSSSYSASAIGNYSVVATNSCGSTPSAAISVTDGTPAVPAITASSPTSFCQGGNVVLSASSSTAGVTFQWLLNNTPIAGATSATYIATAGGAYAVVATGTGNCTSASTATAVTVDPLPATPAISQNGNTLISSSATGNQWYLNGTAIPGATNQTYVITANGTYTVVTTAANGCVSAPSAAVNVINTGIAAKVADLNVKVYPNPATEFIYVKFSGTGKNASATLYNLTGQQLLSETIKGKEDLLTIDVKPYAKGTYLLKIFSEHGTRTTRVVIH